MSTALTYLAAARARPNLEIRPDTTIDRVEVEHGRAQGVRLQGGDVVEAGTVVLAAGTYASPAILLRSGIGPAAQLRELGLPVAVDLPGVGANLVDHPLVSVNLPVGPGRRGTAAPGGAHDAHHAGRTGGRAGPAAVHGRALRRRGRAQRRATGPAGAPGR